MKINEIIENSLVKFLLEAEKKNKTSNDTYKQINALKKYGFDANKTIWDNGSAVADRYKQKVIELVIQHAQNLNKEIYHYISSKYNLKAIYWKTSETSETSISQYTYFVLKNGTRLGVRVSDHSKVKNPDAKTILLPIFYNTSFNDILKHKIDYFIKKYSGNQNYKKLLDK